MKRKPRAGASAPKRGRNSKAVKPAPNAENAVPAAAPIEHAGAGFPIVGIGASAGGLAAFEAFFSGMPAGADPGMGFVLVQHLAPDHKSILTDLIRRYTRMRVVEVEDGMVVHPNCAYIIPPNRDMALLKGTLHLLEPTAPRGQRLPIDFFFRSLAQDQHERAIGIVLSGTGSDGTLGVRAIKGENGMVMAQSPASTEHDGMPRSALATGLVDFELPPAEMPAQLIAYTSHAFGARPHSMAAPAPRAESAVKRLLILLRAHTGHDFSQYKPSTILRRIERRMAVHLIQGLDSYVQFLQRTPAELDALFQDLLIGVTSFFRDAEAFRALEELVIPKLVAAKPPGSTIRVWSPGCSSGEEAYSIAILLRERMEALKVSYHVQVFATDIDGHAIGAARVGLYPVSIEADLAPARLASCFDAESDHSAYRATRSIRDMLVFSEQDLIRDPPFSKIDLISCRNLLIYMGSELQERLIPLFHYALNPGGFLFLGTSETVGEHGDLFSTVDRKAKLYQRREEHRGAHRTTLDRFVPPVMWGDRDPQPARARVGGQRKQPARELTEQALLQQAVPPSALVDSRGDVLYLHGRTGLFLEPAPGEAGINNILKMAREGLRTGLSAALRKAAVTQGVVRQHGLRVRTNGGFTTVNLTIRPVSPRTAPFGSDTVEAGDASMPGLPTDVPLYLVTLEDAPSSDLDQVPPPPGPGGAKGAKLAGREPAPAIDADARIAALRQDLRAKEEYLQATIEELESANQELKSSNEEMQSVNEELQSTNEELETSKEELQSVNEELATINAELQSKVADLSRVNNDMNNLLAGTGIGTVFVDLQLRILRFTPAATQIINLILSDIGRPVGHIASNLVGYDRLVADVQAVLDTLVPLEVDVQTTSGAWYTMRIRPYRTLHNVIEGAVISYVDITDVKRTQDALQKSEAKFRGLFENTVSAVALHEIVLDEGREPVDYIYLEANQAFEQHTGLRVADILGRRATQVHPGIEKTDLIATYGRVALRGGTETFETWFEPTGRRYSISAYQVGPNRFATVFVTVANRGPEEHGGPAGGRTATR